VLIELHMIQCHAPSNLNRDDTGSPKDCIFGGVRRSRISSQCIKRSIRMSDVFRSGLQGVDLGIRTRRLPSIVRDAMIELGFSSDMADLAGKKASGFGNKDGTEQQDLETAQIMFISQHDVDTIIDVIAAAAKETGDVKTFKDVSAKELQKSAELAGWRPITPDIALFGRMITSAAFRDVQASAQVAHAISVNKMDHEFDYFTAVDDLVGTGEDDETGAAMIDDVEFNSACYYKYMSLDYDGLVSNLAGLTPTDEGLDQARRVAAHTILAFVRAAALVTPTGKQNSFAAHQLPSAILVEVRNKKMPVSYANAFVKPVTAGRGKDLIEASIEQFACHVDILNRKYGLQAEPRLWFCTEPIKVPETRECESFDALLDGVARAVEVR